MTAGDVVTLTACPECGAAAGSWCVRHGRVQPGPLLCCAARFRVRAACPAGDVADMPHEYVVGTGAVVVWDVLGDPRGAVEVCRSCAGGLHKAIDDETAGDRS
jgi:hypothetical protein